MAQDDLIALAEALSAAEDPFVLFEAFARKRGALGYFYGYSALRGDLGTNGGANCLFHHHTYPEEWEKTFGARSMVENDFTLVAMDGGQSYVEWLPSEYHAFVATLPLAQRKRFEAEVDMGIVHGASLLLDGYPGGFAGLGLWYETQPSPQAFRREWAEHGESLTAAAHLLNAAVRNDRPNLLVRLTPREVDCLSWLARGLRPAEICWRLTISEKTFEKHISSAKIKLKSRTRDQALAKAVLMRLLPL